MYILGMISGRILELFCKEKQTIPPIAYAATIAKIAIPNLLWKSPASLSSAPKYTIAKNPLIHVMIVTIPMHTRCT